MSQQQISEHMAANKYSLVVVGGGGVGKSAITLNFMRGQYVWQCSRQSKVNSPFRNLLRQVCRRVCFIFFTL